MFSSQSLRLDCSIEQCFGGDVRPENFSPLFPEFCPTDTAVIVSACIAEDIDNGNPVSDLDVAGLVLSITAAPTYEHEGAPLNGGV